MSRAGRFNTLPIAILMCLITGCSLPGASHGPAKQAYLLHVDHPASKSPVPAESTSCVTLRISPPQSAPGFMTSRMAYMTKPPRIDYFAYHEWVDTPARMLASTLESRLDNIGLFGAVVSGSADIRANYRLDLEVQRLLQVFDAETTYILLAVKVNLVDVSTRALLSARTFSYQETADGSNPEAGASAANRATERFVDDLVASLSTSFQTIDCSPSQ